MASDIPFSYLIRESNRAKRIQLHITEKNGLEVVIPKRLVRRTNINALLQEKKTWILKHLEDRENTLNETKTERGLPQIIDLRALQENWTLQYLTFTRWKLLENPLKELTLLGDLQNAERCRKLLITWIKKRAVIYLTQFLRQLSFETKLNFNKIQIRGQQTRWGSCSSNGDISLNYQLLFLPPHLVRHILLHELVHTVHMNHGIRFWRLLMKFDPETKQHAYEARRARKYVPKWLYPETLT